MKQIHPSFFKKMVAYCFIILMLFHISACTYFRVKQASREDIPTLVEMGENYKYFVLHQGDELYHLDVPVVEDNMLKGTLLDASMDSIYYNETRSKIITTKEKSILNEIHVYTSSDQESFALGEFSIPIAQIDEIRVIKSNPDRSVLTFLGATAGVLAIIAIIVALTKSSCPYLYVYNGEEWIFEGEIYGGAILQNLERDDYMPLPHLQPQNGVYKLSIANELKEEQFTNLAELVIIDHPQHTSVLLDQRGQAHLLQALQLPTQARTFSGQDIKPQLLETDRSVFLFDEIEADQNGVNLHFDKPKGVTSGKLVLNAKNSLWFDWVFGEFTKKFGGYYPQWIKKQTTLTTEERWQMAIDQEFPLTVSVKIGDDWQLVDHLPTVGPLAARDLVIPLDFSQYQADDIEVRLQSGFLFWELDYAAIDFSSDTEMKRQEATLISAISQDGQDHMVDLRSDDDRYLEQLNVGDATELQFRAIPVAEGRTQSTFLHSKGYYQHIRSYEGLPELGELEKFRNPSHFSEFSKQLYLTVISDGEEIATVTQ